MSVKAAFERHVHYNRGVLRVCDDLYQIDSFSRVAVIAFGRHAHEMAELLAAQCGTLAGIISTPLGDTKHQLPGLRYFHGGSPLPNAESARAADAILKSLTVLPANSLVVFLLSSGSSFVESAKDKEISIDDLAATYNMLGESDCRPDEARAILKHLSAIKGGGMAVAAGRPGVQQVSILFLDRAGDPPASLACGPTMPDETSVEDCYRIAAQYELTEKFPSSVRELFVRRALEETPDKDHPAFHNCRWWPIFS